MSARLIAVVGPTASGKTDLAVELARRMDGEVISADSRQVYRGLDIGTEKVTARDMRGVTHHCIDVASPRMSYSVDQWRRCAERAIRSIHRRGRVPIVAGGTGLYVDALVYGIDFPAVKPNTALRRALARTCTEDLCKMLAKLDPARAATIEHGNPRRLIRAIEVATALGNVPALAKRRTQYDVIWIGLNPPFADLEQRIQMRLQRALKCGLVAETRMLRERLRLSWRRIDELGLEYRAVGSFLRGELPKDKLGEVLFREVRRYAKRQLRWLKRNSDIRWYQSAEEALTHHDS